MTTPNIAECFLCGRTSEEVIIHGVRIFDPLSNSIDTAYISDGCWRMVCGSDDQVVAHMWKGWKQAHSAGFTERGFISELASEFRELKCQLHVYFNSRDFGPRLLVVTNPISPTTGDLRLWCLSEHVLPGNLCDTAVRILKTVTCSVPWIGDRFSIASSPKKDGPDVVPNEKLMKTLLYTCTKEWGDPPDPFRYISFNETRAAYEIIRRFVL